MRKLLYSLVFFALALGVIFALESTSAYASHCADTDYDCQLSEIQQEIDALTPAHEQNKQELANLKDQLGSLETRINSISTALRGVEADIAQREEDLAYAQAIFEEKAENHYKFLRLYDPIIPFFASEDASEAFRQINFRQKAADEDRKVMDQYAQDLFQLKQDKDELEGNQASLASIRAQVNERAEFLGEEVEKVAGYLAELSSKQQDILAAKSGSFITSVGDSDLADDYYASIKGFREAAPSGSFAVFSFGAYTHRKGMSQYGARGRANNGQDYSAILNAYYGKSPVDKPTGGTISVEGYGNIDFETTYLYGIAEMPSSWHPEALKAQAVAARTYAYRYKVEGRTICVTESCQVFRKSKSDSPPAEWKAAVDATKGKVLEDVVTFYSSTSGGYLTTMGWDTTDGNGGSDFLDRTYEKIGGSPWVYKAWYTEGYSPSSAKCGRSNPWLNSTEMADIVNAAILVKEGREGDDRLTPVTTSCWGGNPYSHDELRSVAGGISSVSSIVVTQGNGSTNSVNVNGSLSFSGADFKKAFNLRAPGYLKIPQSGFAFFNIESK